MRYSLLTVLFCLFCIAIAGLLPSILTFGGHGRLDEIAGEEKGTACASEKAVESSDWEGNGSQSSDGTHGFIESGLFSRAH